PNHSSNDGDEDNIDSEEPSPLQPPYQPTSASISPKSRMGDFVAQFLENNPEQESDIDVLMDTDEIRESVLDDITKATHLIAIPMEQAHELLLELESVQRAILHHCPILLDACIPHASTRLPLLYIQATEQNSVRVTAALGKLVTRLVKKHIFQRGEINDPGQKDRLNSEGYLPVTMSFQSLEIEGDNNSILNTVGTLENEAENNETIPKSITSASRFKSFMQDLQAAVAAQGWKMTLPPDPNNTNNELFRPRVSFMELPVSFDENLSYYKSQDKELTEDDMEFLTSKNGGNGISPIFWCQWWEDVFAKNVRLREIGIYPHSLMGASEVAGLTRSAQFYLPYETVSLPDGTPSMLQEEKRYQDYQEKRMAEEQEKVYKANEGKDSAGAQPPKVESTGTTDPDIIMTKTRRRLERIYIESSQLEEFSRDDEPEGDVSQSSKNDFSDDSDDNDGVDDSMAPNHPISPQNDDYMESWMKERIENAVNSLESVKIRKEETKTPPPVKDNPVFKAFKEGTLIPEAEKPIKKTKELGPYPGNDHFVGIWKIIASPTGFEVDDSSEDSSENLILRVDGTTAGGPTLDLEHRHKAAGGTWKFLPQQNGEVLLRIRLVIPPEKTRILVMEGKVSRMGSPSDMSMASRSFGIPEVEERAKRATESQMNLMTCSGQVRKEETPRSLVHIEDAVTKKNKVEVGDFSLMKLSGPKERSEYTITIPRPVRSLD
ncbi:MAG: hypothetical protein SGILL_002869, partial [Bacillariaceae sp.]